ncbi:hypothetical protein LQE92_11875 [Lacrimispora sp. NSJ-141]|uniref:Uncharacterized protein n=1 Tax=Lientehia hominis TaxID=2897778 RepID=A0AAP2RJS6_9FIRM|nr:hypothetical protein [Lientehia hominis]MCD2493312.1 hypothetical protein [Lientehia hominis]
MAKTIKIKESIPKMPAGTKWNIRQTGWERIRAAPVLIWCDSTFLRVFSKKTPER